jgi:hypothetical protein
MNWVIVAGVLHCKEIGSGGVGRVLIAVDGVQLWACWGCIEGGQFVDKLINWDVFSEDSVGRHFVILFLHKF